MEEEFMDMEMDGPEKGNHDGLEIFGNPLFDAGDFFEMLILFSINLVVTLIITRLIYYSIHREKEYVFSFLLSNLAIFLVCILLVNVKLKLGFAFGLFAVLSIVRFRTEPIPIKEMTYFFVIIIVAVINALSSKNVSYAELFFTNMVLIATIYILEKVWLDKQDSSSFVNYEKIELIHPDKRAELIEDLKARTGYNISKVKIGRINFLNDTALVEIFYNTDNKREG